MDGSSSSRSSFHFSTCLFFLAVFPAAGGVDAFVPFCSDDSVFFKRCIISVQSFRRSLARRRRSHVLKVSAAVVLKRQNYWSSSGESRCEAAVLTRQENNSFFMFTYADGLTGFSSIEVKQFREALDVKTSGFRFN